MSKKDIRLYISKTKLSMLFLCVLCIVGVVENIKEEKRTYIGSRVILIPFGSPVIHSFLPSILRVYDTLKIAHI